MKKTMLILMAVGLFSAMPALAEHKKEVAPAQPAMTHSHQADDADCAKECELLLVDCAMQVDSIQQRVQKIKSAIAANGAKPEHAEELKILNKKLKEVNEIMRALNKPGH